MEKRKRPPGRTAAFPAFPQVLPLPLGLDKIVG